MSFHDLQLPIDLFICHSKGALNSGFRYLFYHALVNIMVHLQMSDFTDIFDLNGIFLVNRILLSLTSRARCDTQLRRRSHSYFDLDLEWAGHYISKLVS